MKLAVAGATGRVGRHVVDVLRGGGHDVVGMSRSSGVDVISGEGLAQALVGVECVIDVTSGPSPEEKAATGFFTTATRNLQAAGKQAGVNRMVVISIIGIDRFKAGYMAAKRAHEKLVRSAPIASSILRAAQFHEFVGQLVEWGRVGEVSYLQKMKIQPVAARSVAEALADMALHPRAGSGGTQVLEIAGPRAENLVDVAEQLVARRGDNLKIVGVSNPADPDRALYESGALLPGKDAALAGPTFAEWLESTFRPALRTGRPSA